MDLTDVSENMRHLLSSMVSSFIHPVIVQWTLEKQLLLFKMKWVSLMQRCLVLCFGLYFQSEQPSPASSSSSSGFAPTHHKRQGNSAEGTPKLWSRLTWTWLEVGSFQMMTGSGGCVSVCSQTTTWAFLSLTQSWGRCSLWCRSRTATMTTPRTKRTTTWTQTESNLHTHTSHTISAGESGWRRLYRCRWTAGVRVKEMFVEFIVTLWGKTWIHVWASCDFWSSFLFFYPGWVWVTAVRATPLHPPPVKTHPPCWSPPTAR